MKGSLMEALRTRLPVGYGRRSPTVRPAPRGQERGGGPAPVLAPVPVPAPLAVRVRLAIDSAHSRHQPAMTAQEIAAGTAALRPSGAIPADLLQQVLDTDQPTDQPTGQLAGESTEHGGTDGLTAAQLATLAELLGLPVAYFLGTDAEIEDIDASLELLRVLRDLRTLGARGAVPYICGRAGALTAPRMRAYSDLLRRTPELLEEHDVAPARPSSTAEAAGRGGAGTA